MPKHGKFYHRQITFSARSDLRDSLIALAYFRGQRGEYSSVVRDLLTESLKQKIHEMSASEKAQYKEILESVKARGIVEQMEREEKQKERLKIEEPSLDLQASEEPHDLGQ